MTLIKNINFSVDIQEKGLNNRNEFFIEGTAINVTTTSNGHVFLAEELEPSAESLKNTPLLKDHTNSVDNIVGKVVESRFENNKVPFKAQVIDKAIQEKIELGLINSVSVGAQVKAIEEELNEEKEPTGNYILRGITFKELSLVAIGADENATFAMAISEAMKIQKDEDKKLADKLEDDKLAEETKKSIKELMEEKEVLEAEVLALENKKLEERKAALIKEEAEPEAEPEKEEPEAEPEKDDTKGEVSGEEEEDKASESLNGYTLESSDLGGVRMSVDYKSNTKLKNLVRD